MEKSFDDLAIKLISPKPPPPPPIQMRVVDFIELLNILKSHPEAQKEIWEAIETYNINCEKEMKILTDIVNQIYLKNRGKPL